MIKFPTTYTHAEKLRLAHALFQVGRLDETKPLLEWLRSEEKRLENDNKTEPDADAFRQRQGALQVLDVQLTEMSKADDRYRQLKDNE